MAAKGGSSAWARPACWRADLRTDRAPTPAFNSCPMEEETDAAAWATILQVTGGRGRRMEDVRALALMEWDFITREWVGGADDRDSGVIGRKLASYCFD